MSCSVEKLIQEKNMVLLIKGKFCKLLESTWNEKQKGLDRKKISSFVSDGNAEQDQKT